MGYSIRQTSEHPELYNLFTLRCSYQTFILSGSTEGREEREVSEGNKDIKAMVSESNS